jgi:hypothetical protein
VNWPEVRVNGKWVLCVSTDCGTRFAQIANDRSSSASGRWPWLGSGWVSDGPPPTDPLDNLAVAEKRGLTVWRMTKRARERFLKGEPPVFRRRPPDRESFVNDPKEDLSRGYDRPDNWEIRLWPLPSLIVCPRCERVQLITDEVLSAAGPRRATIRRTENPGIRSG